MRRRFRCFLHYAVQRVVDPVNPDQAPPDGDEQADDGNRRKDHARPFCAGSGVLDVDVGRVRDIGLNVHR